MDIVDDPSTVEAIQSRIMRAKVAIFGIGGVGGWIARELVMMGFRRLVLVDPDTTEGADVARHAFSDAANSGVPKVDVVAEGLRAIDPDVDIETAQIALNVGSRLEELVADVHVIVNTADDPYIGYTSVKLSRYAVKHNLPLLIAGGFDAHLASFGEMIVPGRTPCADCYVRHFKTALADWKPVPHPVENRRGGFGGWAPLSIISASSAALMLLKYFIDPELVVKGGRIEFLATDYSIQSFEVARDPNCRICGNS